MTKIFSTGRTLAIYVIKKWKLLEHYEDSSFSLFLLSATANIAPREKSQLEKSFCRKVLKVPTVYNIYLY